MNATPSGITRRELLAFLGILALAIAALPAIGGAVLWTRPLWLDELCCVVFVVNDASSVPELVSTIARGGGDYAPPLLHLVVWSFRRLGGSLTPVPLHTLSLVCVSLALLLVYATLRRRFDRAPSAAGTLAVASHSLVLAHAFEARFYGPWVLFAAGYAWSLGITSSRWRMLAQAAFSTALATIHWFGVFSLGLMVGAAVLTHGRRWREGAQLVAPSAAGAVAFLACLPMAVTQLRASAGFGWVPPLDIGQVRMMAGLFWLSGATVIAGTLLFIGALRGGDHRPPLAGHFRSPGIAAVTSLALMPVVLILFSKLVQPAMVPRYGIVAALAWAPLWALAAANLGRIARGLIVAVAAVLLSFGVQGVIAEKRQFSELVRVLSAAFAEAKAAGVPIASTSVHILYAVAGPERSPQSPARFLDLPDSTITALFPANEMAVIRWKLEVERALARGHAQAYGFPLLATQAQLDSADRFILLATDISLPAGYRDAKRYGSALFPRHRVTRLNPFLALFERTE